MANCETHGHMWGSDGLCLFCKEPKPFRCPHGWHPWSGCEVCSRLEKAQADGGGKHGEV